MRQPGAGIDTNDQCVDDDISDLFGAVDVVGLWACVVFPITENIQSAFPAVRLLV